MKNKITNLKWRRVLKLSAFLLITISFTFSCKKPESKLGKEVYDPEALLDANGVDTFQLVTYCEVADSVISGQTPTVVLGSYNDPIFGRVDGSFYSQFRLATNNPDFGDLGTITIDSMVLSLEYRDNYGEITGPQTYEVYRLEESLSLDSTYYNFMSKTVGMTSLVPVGSEVILPQPNKQTVVGNDTLPNPQLRIPLDINYAWEILNASQNGTLANNNLFLEEFKGLYIKTNNPMWSQGDGSILFFDLRDPDSKLTIYYTQNSEPKTFSLVANTSCAYYNHVDFDNIGSKAKFVIDNPEQGMYEFYAQAGLIRAKVEFPTLTNLSNKTVIHRAMLYLPISYFTGDEFYPSFVTVASTNVAGVTGEIALGSNQYNNTFKRYSFLLTAYLQDVVKSGGSFQNVGIKIAPTPFGATTERIVFNGPLTTNKEKPRLVITYTEY